MGDIKGDTTSLGYGSYGTSFGDLVRLAGFRVNRLRALEDVLGVCESASLP